MKSRPMDAIEAVANAVIGLTVSALVVWLVFPLMGWPVSPGKSAGVSVLFFALSVARSYVLRRAFRALER